MRTTIYLDDDLRERLQRFVPPRKLNRFINEAVAMRIHQLEAEATADAMREGYLATRRDREELNRDWAVLDTEDWPA